jgi:hypothetical protein
MNAKTLLYICAVIGKKIPCLTSRRLSVQPDGKKCGTFVKRMLKLLREWKQTVCVSPADSVSTPQLKARRANAHAAVAVAMGSAPAHAAR